jgi:tRNA A-37 threonylcarbamoyl transferase component Bud32
MAMLKNISIKIEDGKAILNGLVIEIRDVILKRAFKPGANGIVFQAHELILDRPVAVKVWLPRKEDHRDKIEQALGEARKIAKLDHPNIVKIFTPGQLDNGLFYIIMQLLPGEPLKAFLKKKPDLRIRFDLWYDIYNALIYAHSQHVYHGDLHGGNIIINKDHAKLIDFATSIFAKKRGDNPLQRESQTILRLVKLIFPEFDMLLRHKLNLSEIKPETILQISDALVRINLDLLEISKAIKINDDYLIRGKLFNICTEIENNPFFEPEYIIKLLRDININEIYIGYFLDILLSYIKAKIEGDYCSSVKPDPDTPIEKKLNFVNKLLKKLRPIILSS